MICVKILKAKTHEELQEELAAFLYDNGITRDSIVSLEYSTGSRTHLLSFLLSIEDTTHYVLLLYQEEDDEEE